MRTSFLNGEDKQLISLAYEWEGAGKRISWKDLASRMRRKRRPGELEQRLRALKRTYGKDIARFPRSEMAVQDIYRSVSAADIRQEAGKTDGNAGEMLPTAVTSILQMIGDVRQEDVFLDVGAGLGHVVAQVALQTNAHRCLGIEKRHDVVSAGARCVRSHVSLFGHLRKALVLTGDVLDTPLSTRAPFKAATLIFLNDFLFTEEAKLVVQEELSGMPNARAIVSTSLYCPRHRDSCRNLFCGRWKRAGTTYGHCSWKSQLVPIYLYAPRNV
eukprot:jgi/Phyca11/116739/e_gw1.31.124.1